MTARQWLIRAREEKFAIGAFNVGNIETFRAIAQAAANKRSPVIIESSPGETDWMGADNVVDIARNFEWEYKIPILVNLDHSTTLEDCEKGILVGFDLIHCDASKLPYEENVALTRKVSELAHAKGLTAEGELDHIGGSSEVHKVSAAEEAQKTLMTDPKKAAEFVQATGIDIFAAFVGNVHGLYVGQSKHLDAKLVKEIAEATGVFLSLHGSSGIPESEVKEAIKNGVVKVNLNTEMRQAFKDSFEKVLKANPEEYAMYKVEGSVVETIQKLVERKIDVFGSAGKA